MKFSTFRGLAIAGGIVLGVGAVIGTCALCVRSSPDQPRPTADVAATNMPLGPSSARPPSTLAPQPARPPATATATTPSAAGNLRPMDTAVLQKIAQNIPGEKVKDAFPGQTYKVNLFKDPGQAGVNRVKIDLDRDEKWDEKWDIESEGGRQEIKRQVAPADDEKYTENYRLRDGSWVKK